MTYQKSEQFTPQNPKQAELLDSVTAAGSLPNASPTNPTAAIGAVPMSDSTVAPTSQASPVPTTTGESTVTPLVTVVTAINQVVRHGSLVELEKLISQG